MYRVADNLVVHADEIFGIQRSRRASALRQATFGDGFRVDHGQENCGNNHVISPFL
jgi:hypothetical protein